MPTTNNYPADLVGYYNDRIECPEDAETTRLLIRAYVRLRREHPQHADILHLWLTLPKHRTYGEIGSLIGLSKNAAAERVRKALWKLWPALQKEKERAKKTAAKTHEAT